jgi:MYXO-CTERM domain-containing protein
MKIGFIAFAGAASLVASADAGFAGFVAYSRNVGANTVIDVFAAVTNASDKFLNVYDLQSNGSFVQKNTLATKSWKPDIAGFTSTRAVSDDSFMTAGTFGGGLYGGEYYASGNTTGDPNFLAVAGAWNATPGSTPAATIPNNAGWYTGDPPSVDNGAELMSTWASSVSATRRDSNLVSTIAPWAAPATSAGATYGIWVSHLVVAGNNKLIGIDFTFAASASIKDGATGATTQARYNIPAPGALAVLGLAGFASRRRRA